MRPQPMVIVHEVEAASRWFQDVLGLVSAHGGPDFEMLVDGGDVVLQLHRWEADEHPALGNPDDPSRGNGILLWFTTDDFDSVVRRATEHRATVVDGPLDNPNSGQREVWLRAPEGYTVVASGQ